MPGGIKGERPRRELTPQQENQAEQDQAQKKNPPSNASGERNAVTASSWAKMQEEGRGAGVFRCLIPKHIWSPFEIQRLHDQEITKEQAIEEGQPWVEDLKTKDKQKLEHMRESLEKFQREGLPRVREKWRTQKQVELLEYEIESIREELRQRGSD